MFKYFRRQLNRGQSAMEYALVIGVIVTGIIIAAQNFVSDKDSATGKIFEKAIGKASETLEDSGSD